MNRVLAFPKAGVNESRIVFPRGRTQRMNRRFFGLWKNEKRSYQTMIETDKEISEWNQIQPEKGEKNEH